MLGMRLVLTLATALLATPAPAHTGADAAHGFAAGFAHPLLGLDHVLAMLCVGIWAALVGGRAVWAWPAAFLTATALGAAAAAQGVELRAVEAVIAVSVLVLGLAVAARLRPALGLGAALCGGFAAFHGYAHSAEAPAAGSAEHVFGFLLATALLHGVGVTIGIALCRPGRIWLPRLAGGAVAMIGLTLLAG